MITILIPILNEKNNINILCSKILLNKNLEKIIYKIIFIDDNSNDGSINELNKMSDKYKKVNFIIRKDKKNDLTQSILLGLKKVNSEYVCVMDGDLQHDINAIPKFYKIINNNDYDLIIGSRYIKNNTLNKLRFYRKIFSKIGTIFIKFLRIKNISDPLSGFFLIRTSVFKSVDSKIITNGYKILITILILLKNEIKFKEIQINFYKRKYGFSKLNIKVIYNFIKQIFLLLLISRK
jgi:dolichol-phosphate mannosyltransferase